MLEGFKKTLKSSETEDWLDYRLIRPLSYLWALLFAKLDVHPNTVTIMSMFIGAASAYFFAQASFVYDGMHGLWMNIIGILLLMWADIFDCTDGQLARLTGKKSRLGRILDGAAGFVWFIPIYVMLVYRFYVHHDMEFSWFGIENNETNALIATGVVFLIALYSGFAGIGGQQRLADYYIQIHLFFLKGEKGSELDTSAKQKEEYDKTPWKGNYLWKYFLSTYVDYTRKQEAVTPQFQRLMAALRERYGSESAIPADLREEIHAESKKLMGWNAMLTFNFRSLMFFIFCLCDLPAWNFVFEIVCMGLLTRWINYRHESFCKRIAENIK